ncbi:hypothetical protein D9M70_594240 [compost metagenome]
MAASVVLIWARVPLRVRVEVLRPITEAPPASDCAERVPWATCSVTVRLPEPASTSAMLRPLMLLGVPAGVVWAPGRVLTGASLTGVISRLALPAALSEPSVTE